MSGAEMNKLIRRPSGKKVLKFMKDSHESCRSLSAINDISTSLNCRNSQLHSLSLYIYRFIPSLKRLNNLNFLSIIKSNLTLMGGL